MDPPEVSAFKLAAYQAVAGGAAGALEICLLHPLDVMKIRMQLQTASQSHYTGLLDGFIKMYRQEGIGSYYKGIVPPLLVDSPKRCVKFLAYEQFKALFMFGSEQPTFITDCLSGATIGLFEGVVINPFEMVKVRQQSSRGIENLRTFDVARDIIKNVGFGRHGLYRGLTATICRCSLYNVAFFSLTEDIFRQSLNNWMLGFIGAFIGAFLSTPFDTAKTLIQAPQPVKGEIKYWGTIRTIRMIYREEGFRALYKGQVPRLIRLCPGGAISMLVYEHIYEYLLANYA